jgi:hypothetical protein
VLVSDDETVNISNPRDHTGKRAVFEFQQGFGSRQLPARSEMYLFGLDKWFVEYRFTYPKEAESSSTARIRDFMASLRWPD